MKKTIVFALMILLTLSTSVQALSFGTNIKNGELSLPRGGRGTFTILFFTRDPEPVMFSVSADYPDGLAIYYPKTFELNSGLEGEDYILIDNEYVNAKSLDITVSVPTGMEPGDYSILLKATSLNQDQKTIGVNAEKTFVLKLTVLGYQTKAPQEIPEIEDVIVSDETDNNEDIVDVEKAENEAVDNESEASDMTGMFVADSSTFLLAIIIIIIVLVSYLVYKKV